MTEPVRVIAVVEPTGAGKTEIGITLAQETGGEVISVDSMQIYRWMDIGTAKPTPEMLQKTPHHLIDILNPDETYNAGRFASDADAVIHNLLSQNKTPILVGGTALYLRALIKGIIEVPEISNSVRQNVRHLAETAGVNACHGRLKQLDPKSAEKLHPNDISRISRALEVVLETGISIQDYQANHRFQQQRYQVFSLGCSWPRTDLYNRINRRVHQMVEQGLVNETRGLLKMGYGPELPSMNSIGYRQAVSYLLGEMSKNEMIADIQQKSRRYAKKQLTWYKGDSAILWLEENRLRKSDLTSLRQFLHSS